MLFKRHGHDFRRGNVLGIRILHIFPEINVDEGLDGGRSGEIIITALTRWSRGCTWVDVIVGFGARARAGVLGAPVLTGD